jgi:16S rRNA (guanine966-N2)-methyltransferase
VTRIIAGAIGSLQLKPAAKATRPTSDRVKESLFAKLDAMGAIEGANVLDLFAGTGALGLESASRGAESVTLIERDRKAFELLEQNAQSAAAALSKQGLDPKINTQNLEAMKYLKGASVKFDLVFIDPPYEFSNSDLEALLELLAASVSDDGLIVLERSSHSKDPKLKGYEYLSSKSYGDSKVFILVQDFNVSQ